MKLPWLKSRLRDAPCALVAKADRGGVRVSGCAAHTQRTAL